MEHTDDELLKWYLRGWNDEADEFTVPISTGSKILDYAYYYGSYAYKAGDDLRSFDYMTDAEIVAAIRNGAQDQQSK